MKKTLCAVLCYNNQNTLAKVIKEEKKIKNICDIIFVNDGSSDNTKEILKSYKLKTVNHKKNMGYGRAVKSAFKYASNKNYHFLAIFPADNQRYIEDLKKMIKISKRSDSDLVVGSKYKVLEKIPPHRKIGNIFFSKMASIFWNCKIIDVLSGFKIYRVNSFYKYIDILPNDYSFDIVLSQLVSFKKMKFLELYVKCRYNNDTSSMMGIFKLNIKNIIYIGFKMIFDIFVFYLKYKFIEKNK